MSVNILFDTLIFSKKLIKAGFPQKQAEILADAQKEVFQEIFDKAFASKTDIKEIKQDIAFLSQNFKQDIELLRKEFEGKFYLLYWMMGFILVFCMTNLFFLIKLSF